MTGPALTILTLLATLPDAEPARRGVALMVLLILLALLMLGAAGLLMLMGSRRRRLRRAAAAPKPEVRTPDPWTESAKRMATPIDTDQG